MKDIRLLIAVFLLTFVSCKEEKSAINSDRPCFSGVYPHLAFYNDEDECGTGAVVPWAGRLWAMTYGPHLPYGSSDKLYEITDALEMTVRSESAGGTPASRMIHRESDQLFIGPYAIDGQRNVRVISYEKAPGRYTGYARHLTDPANRIYVGTMEAGFYDVDVHTLEPVTLYKDGNVIRREKNIQSASQYSPLLPGCHGKGLYSGQGVMVYSNNGENVPEARVRFDIEAGSLSEWDGGNWKVVRRNQFTEVTGPGGIYGNANPETDPIWSVGWDHKSLILATRDNGGWHFYRLPKASFAYDGAHGWNTEWPRIRDIGTKGNPEYLMTMHGMFWHFPGGFNSKASAGIRPRSAYLKVIGDFTRWHDKLIFGCDDSAHREFLNKRKAKGDIEGPGQSNSNLWFTSIDAPDNLGPATAGGSVWLEEEVAAGQVSEPFLFSGWKNRCAWIKNDSPNSVEFSFETDPNGDGKWGDCKKVIVEPNSSFFVTFASEEKGEWIRVAANSKTQATVSFIYAPEDRRANHMDLIFSGIATVDTEPSSQGLLYGLGDNRRALGMLARTASGELRYYEIDGDMNFIAKDDPQTASFISERFEIPRKAVEIEEGSVLVVDDKGRRWRLPVGDSGFDKLTTNGSLRICREVATERDLFNCHGTFYELPAENADGYAKIRPVASHNLRINDYASYRGLLVMTGIGHNEQARDNEHIIFSEDGQAAIWAGTIDDLWKLGKPVGSGGPWVNSKVIPSVASDPYLIGFYDDRTLNISHKSTGSVVLTAEVDPTGDNSWVEYMKFTVRANESVTHRFPDAFQARWIRFRADRETVVTTWLEYK